MERMQMPKISIVMATWNRAGLLAKTIESVRAQTFHDWELIIADDGSTDETPKIIKEWENRESRIIYTRSETNIGISQNYNRAFRMARGSYIAMIDDDDPWCDAQKLEKEISFLEKYPDYVGVGGGVIVVNKENKEQYRYLKPETDNAIRSKMLFSNPMANSTTLFRRAIGEKVGWYDETTRYAGDRDFWLKMGLEGKLYNFAEYFSYYTLADQNTSIVRIRPHLKASFMIMRRYKGKYPHYYAAFFINAVQYAYAFLPVFVRKPIHALLARLKRKVAG